KPVPYWEISMDGTAKNAIIQAWHEADKFWEKNKATEIVAKTTGKEGAVSDIKKTSIKQMPPHPFDLTTLQTEAYRLFGMNPKRTADIAQELYTAGYTSYPRTSSQQLPPALGFAKIMKSLSKQTKYRELAEEVLKKKQLIPHNGLKTDPAHPAIYPTGVSPKLIKDQNIKIYDLIVKRFLATFGDPAMRESVTVKINVNTEIFLLKGAHTVTPGWHVLYAPYVKLEEIELPKLAIGDAIKNKKITLYDKETQPPKRYTPSSIIKELEKRNLGTKATRADIVETLYDRNYVKNESLQATQLGMHIIKVLAQYSPKIIDEELTRHFEADMDEIRAQKQKKEKVLAEAKEVLTDILKDFKKNEQDIGKGLLDVVKEQRETTSTVGACPICKQGTLKIRRGKFGMFIACDKYPDCKTTFKLPVAKNHVTKELCPVCNYPMIAVVKRGTQNLCINLDCPTKQENTVGFKEHPCPKCGKGTVILRKSLYGAFAACNKFPACRYALRLGKKKELASKNKVAKKNNS
ncbi:MAG: DNA topoisomerase, partial [Candidatus Woesearchaeota archaeon]|nr:DNA topoisomerase [Candidatus Woesearchaeota archaeon]